MMGTDLSLLDSSQLRSASVPTADAPGDNVWDVDARARFLDLLAKTKEEKGRVGEVLRAHNVASSSASHWKRQIARDLPEKEIRTKYPHLSKMLLHEKMERVRSARKFSTNTAEKTEKKHRASKGTKPAGQMPAPSQTAAEVSLSQIVAQLQNAERGRQAINRALEIIDAALAE